MNIILRSRRGSHQSPLRRQNLAQVHFFLGQIIPVHHHKYPHLSVVPEIRKNLWGDEEAGFLIGKYDR